MSSLFFLSSPIILVRDTLTLPFMPFNPPRLALFLSSFNKARYCAQNLLSSLSLHSFSTLDSHLATSSHAPSSNLDERHVLDELSTLLPLPLNDCEVPKNLITQPHHQTAEEVEIQPLVDSFLLPEEKLRGVFLQRLKGVSAIEHSLSSASVDLNLDVVARVLNRGNLGGQSMIIFFNWALKQPMIPNDIGSYNVLIKALGRRKYVEFIVKILREMRMNGVSVTLETLAIVMDSLVRARRIYKAIETFETFGFESNVESLNVMLHCVCKRSHVGAAHSYLNSLKGKMSFNSMTYNIIIGGWSRFGRVSEMERLLELMVEDGFSPDSLTYSFLIEGMGRAGMIEGAVRIFSKMGENGCLPDTGVYNAMIFNFVSAGDLDEGMKYYKCMLNNSCDPNVHTYSKLILGLIKARKVADALEMFNEMLGRGIFPATGAVTSFIEPLCSFGPPHAAMLIYKRARKAGCEVSLNAYKLLLMRLSRFGKCGMLLNIWDEMQECGNTSDMEVYEYVINGLCNIGQLENAVLVMEESLCKGFCPSRLIYSKLNNKLLASNKVEMAYRLFLKIKASRQDDNARRFWRRNGWHF